MTVLDQVRALRERAETPVNCDPQMAPQSCPGCKQVEASVLWANLPRNEFEALVEAMHMIAEGEAHGSDCPMYDACSCAEGFAEDALARIAEALEGRA